MWTGIRAAAPNSASRPDTDNTCALRHCRCSLWLHMCVAKVYVLSRCDHLQCLTRLWSLLQLPSIIKWLITIYLSLLFIRLCHCDKYKCACVAAYVISLPYMFGTNVHRYRDADEPQLGSHSVTIRPSPADLQKLHSDAEDTWTPAFVKLIKVST